MESVQEWLRRGTAGAVLLGCCLLASAAAGDWLGFRGDGRSAAEEADPPASWSLQSGENVAWQAALPGRGVSSPIVVAGRVIVTSSDGPEQRRLHICAFDEATGKPLWHRRFWATGRTLVHETSAVAANTPVSDGQRVFAFFSSNDLFALDLDGNVQWMQGLQYSHPLAGIDIGMASSPTVVDGAVIVQSEAQGDAFVAAFEVATGALRWQVDRPKKSGWASPLPCPATRAGKSLPAVAVMSNDGFEVLAAKDGSRLWGASVNCNVSASPVVVSDAVFVTAQGVSQFEFDAAAGEAKSPWQATALQTGYPSPVIVGDKAYVLKSDGVLGCATIGGGVDWRLRLGGRFYATPALAGPRLYCVNEAGKAYVVQLDPAGGKGKVAAEIEFGAGILASPSLAQDAVYFRSYDRIWKIARTTRGAAK